MSKAYTYKNFNNIFFDTITDEKYKFELVYKFEIQTSLKFDKPIIHEYFTISENGKMVIFPKYRWDGCSAKILKNRKENCIGCLSHDVFFQAMREKLIPLNRLKEVNLFFRETLINCGLNKFLAWNYYYAVSIFGKKHARPKEKIGL
jgi:hypothetical protein